MTALFTMLSFPNDSGPIYQETVAGRFPVEPFNTFSNFLFLAFTIYYARKVYPDYRNQLFLAYSLPVLFIGFIGGTVYHATRSHEIWLILDWLPILLLCLAVSVYFIFLSSRFLWQRIVLAVIVLLLVFGVRYIPFGKFQISVNYLGTASGLLLPLFVYLYKTHFKYWGSIVLAILSFGLALSFRVMDKFMDELEMGTHWLWHTFGAISVFFLMKYIYKSKNLPEPASPEGKGES
ncbi:hypothetical protein RM553_04005 [Zunongwangia sp. F363]|uniref:Ceramidase n=1 Tax=Autumnicola tepida TaxID=3075595 RepID=A0ABU3C6M2_9FLAO|nr:hypothetical protein [Zunongwangia sp. F363]MDT0641988.1 hypothetical protein [Zunongwangia sp. F363]